jgi:hypothetical protein
MKLKLLGKYSALGKFSFSHDEELKNKCNAPNNQGGVYLIFDISRKKKKLLYIGSSGQGNNAETLKVKKGGLFDRIVNGDHQNRFDNDKSGKAFLKQMFQSGIDKIEIKWWALYNVGEQEFSTASERVLKSMDLEV